MPDTGIAPVQVESKFPDNSEIGAGQGIDEVPGAWQAQSLWAVTRCVDREKTVVGHHLAAIGQVAVHTG